MTLIPTEKWFDFDRMFGDFLPALPSQGAKGFFTPRVDVKDAGDHYEISAELPGVPRENIHVEVQDGVLSLEAETSSESKQEAGGKVIRQERRYGKFVRTFQLGKDVKESDIQAKFENGVLHLSAPKATAAEAKARRIQIS